MHHHTGRNNGYGWLERKACFGFAFYEKMVADGDIKNVCMNSAMSGRIT